MRIGLQSGGNTYWLAGESGVAESVHSSVRDYTLTGDRQLEVAKLVKTPFSRQFDRESQTNEVSFGSTRTFTSADLCFIFTLDYLDNIPLTGTLIFEVDIPGGGMSTRYMANAVMQRPEMDPVGVSLALEFTVSGGEITGGSSSPLGPGHYLTDSSGVFRTGTGGLFLTGT